MMEQRDVIDFLGRSQRIRELKPWFWLFVFSASASRSLSQSIANQSRVLPTVEPRVELGQLEICCSGRAG